MFPQQFDQSTPSDQLFEIVTETKLFNAFTVRSRKTNTEFYAFQVATRCFFSLRRPLLVHTLKSSKKTAIERYVP
jgi:hypothetical protein